MAKPWKLAATAAQPRVQPALRAVNWYPWIAMGVVLIGSYMVILDSTIVNVALPQIGVSLHQSSGVEWIVTAYLLAVGVSQPATGWLADRLGRKRIFTTSLAAFGAGSLLAAASPNLSVLIGCRVLQGLGGGAMMPVGMTMIYELFPPDRRGMALGTWGIASTAAPAVGPVLGGYIVTVASWRWLFVINGPIGVIGVIAAVRLLKDFGFREQRRFDAVGFGLIGAGLVALLLVFSEAATWGWTSPRSLVLLAAGSGLLAAFIWHGLHRADPLIALRMFQTGTFSITIVIVCLLTLIQFGRLVFIPLELETMRGMSALEVGIILTPSALGAALTMPLGGRLADRIGARTPVVLGTAIVGVVAWLLAHLTPTSSVGYLAGIVALQGLGNGLAIMPNSVAGLNSLPGRYVAQASAVRSLMRQVAGALGVGILATLVAARIGSVSASVQSPGSLSSAQAAYNLVFMVGFGATALAFCLAFLLPGRRAMKAMQAERAAELVDVEA